MRVIVIDDGSKDNTFEVAREAYAKEIAEGRVTILTKPNGGKAAALILASSTWRKSSTWASTPTR